VTTAFITHPVCLQHEMGAHHPESPARLQAVYDAFDASGLMSKLTRVEAPLASEAQLEAAHSPDYVAKIFQSAPLEDYAYLDPDTAMNPHTIDAARRAAGAVIAGVDMVMADKIDNAFCAVRPCGHHATHNQAMGFCIFNNVAVGAMHAIESYGMERVAILDFDVHHGNGTEDIFHDDPRIIPTPLAARTSGAKFRQSIDATWWPALEKFQPQFIIISAGFDAHADDPLAYLELHEDDYAWITTRIREIADKFAEGRIVSALEGGYNLGALGRSAVAHVNALL
jgi:acetoin utilization deacetylase AcuC-like enzyme